MIRKIIFGVIGFLLLTTPCLVFASDAKITLEMNNLKAKFKEKGHL